MWWTTLITVAGIVLVIGLAAIFVAWCVRDFSRAVRHSRGSRVSPGLKREWLLQAARGRGLEPVEGQAGPPPGIAGQEGDASAGSEHPPLEGRYSYSPRVGPGIPRVLFAGRHGVLRVLVYEYTENHRSSGETRSLVAVGSTVLACDLAGNSIPRFLLLPRSGRSSWRGFAPAPRIPQKFDSHPEFSRRYNLSAQQDDVQAVRELFGPEVLDLLQSLPGWGVDFHESRILIYRGGYAIGSMANTEAFLKDALSILDHLVPAGRRAGPDHVPDRPVGRRG